MTGVNQKDRGFERGIGFLKEHFLEIINEQHTRQVFTDQNHKAVKGEKKDCFVILASAYQ